MDLSFIPEIDYNSLNEQWYDPKIEMLIITPDDISFIDAVKPLMDWKNKKGVKTIILSNFTQYNGTDDAERLRNMIKSYYEEEDIQWVLLAGDAQNDIIPIRNVYNPDVIRWGGGRSETVGGEYYKPTDFYYADLSSTWDNDGIGNNGDGNWGEAPKDTDHGLDEISWIPEVYVGRFPANNANELEIMINKTLKYETNPSEGNWTNRMLLAGGVSSYSVSGDDSGEYESTLTNYIIQNYAKSVINCTHLVKEAGNLSRTVLNNYFNNGYSTVIMAGHGAPAIFYIDPYTAGYTDTDANSCSNTHMPSLVYLDACTMSSYDINDGSIGELLIKRMDAGAIGVIGAIRVSWYYEDDTNLEKLNRGNAKLFWYEFYENKKFQQGRALYDSKVSYINSDYYTKGSGSTTLDFERKNILTYNLLGDPEIDIYTDNPKNIADPFNEESYEGGFGSVIVKDTNDSIIPYARVHFRTSDGKYFTTYADINGVAKFRLPKQPNELYNVTITGHNSIPSYFNFTAEPDTIKPELSGVSYSPRNPSTSDIIVFNVDVYDNHSGIESVHLFISDNNFENYSYYTASNEFLENENNFTFNIDRYLPGEYSYFIVARDYANNTNIFYEEDLNFVIPKHIAEYIFPISLIVVGALVGVSILSYFRSIQKSSRRDKLD
ncbi:MAG: C25 family cysteine peptidase [Candidatus Hermodarchaeota archaeon]